MLSMFLSIARTRTRRYTKSVTYVILLGIIYVTYVMWADFILFIMICACGVTIQKRSREEMGMVVT